MPHKCCVPDCKSNYDSYLKTNPPVSTFRFPTKHSVREKWIEAINKKDLNLLRRPNVCLKHFRDEDLRKHARVGGREVLETKLQKIRLYEWAVPSIFDHNTNKHENVVLKEQTFIESTKTTMKKKKVSIKKSEILLKQNSKTNGEEKLHESEDEIDPIFEFPECANDPLEQGSSDNETVQENSNIQLPKLSKLENENDDRINDYDDFIKNYSRKLKEIKINWTIYERNNYIYFLLMDEIHDCAIVRAALKVKKDLSISVQYKSKEIPKSDLQLIFNSEKLTLWCEFLNILLNLKIYDNLEYC